MRPHEEVQYRFSVPPDCCKEVKHVLLAGAGHAYCWKCGVGIKEEAKTMDNPTWPIGRAVQTLMRSALLLSRSLDGFHQTPNSHAHVRDIDHAISEIERLTGIQP